MTFFRAPRLFGSSITTDSKDDKVQHSDLQVLTHGSCADGTKLPRIPYRKSPRILPKRKLSHRNQASSRNESSNHPSTSRECRNSTEITNAENFNTEKWAEADEEQLKCLSPEPEEKNVVNSSMDDIGACIGVEPQKEQEETPSSLNRCMAEPPATLFRPPKEVTIDPDAVPPSPMRDSATICQSLHDLPENHELLLNVRNLRSDQATPPPCCLGYPLGDIAVKRQLLDAQRLVRLILGKPLCGDQQLLETTTILQAIRAFAMMKQELVDLRNKQDILDGFPLALLPELESKIGTCITGNRNDIAHPDNDHVLPQSPPTFEDAKLSCKRIQILQEQLAVAKRTIERMQSERVEDAASTHNIEPTPGNHDEKYQILDEKYRLLLKSHEAAVEESKRNLDAVIDSVASVPNRVLATASVRDKLKSYCATVTMQASQVRIIELESLIQQEREESRRKLEELQERLRRQEENHSRHLAALYQDFPIIAVSTENQQIRHLVSNGLNPKVQETHTQCSEDYNHVKEIKS